MRATRAHAHDAELLWLTRAVRGGQLRETLLSHATWRLDTVRVGEIMAACPTPASRAELLACGDRYGWTALHYACYPRDDQHEDAAAALVELLLGAGADLRARARYADIGRELQPIHNAARWSARLVQRLVQAGASIDGDVAGNSTLCSAARASTAVGVRMIPALVALGARETLGGTVMHHFASNPVKGALPPDGDVPAALTALVSVGCSLTQPDAARSPLDLAALSGNALVVRALLAADVAANAKSLANAVKHSGVVRQLLAAGAPAGELVQFSPADENINPLMQAAWEAVLESVQQLLLGAGASVNLPNEQGRTALMLSVWSESAESAAVLGVVEALLAADADVAACDLAGDTALHYLVIRSYAQPWAAAAARLLLDSGADGRIQNHTGKTPAQAVPVTACGGELHRLLLAAAGA
jgi:ankyrin repeat protein